MSPRMTCRAYIICVFFVCGLVVINFVLLGLFAEKKKGHKLIDFVAKFRFRPGGKNRRPDAFPRFVPALLLRCHGQHRARVSKRDLAINRWRRIDSFIDPKEQPRLLCSSVSNLATKKAANTVTCVSWGALLQSTKVLLKLFNLIYNSHCKNNTSSFLFFFLYVKKGKLFFVL